MDFRKLSNHFEICCQTSWGSIPSPLPKDTGGASLRSVDLNEWMLVKLWLFQELKSKVTKVQPNETTKVRKPILQMRKQSEKRQWMIQDFVNVSEHGYSDFLDFHALSTLSRCLLNYWKSSTITNAMFYHFLDKLAFFHVCEWAANSARIWWKAYHIDCKVWKHFQITFPWNHIEWTIAKCFITVRFCNLIFYRLTLKILSNFVFFCPLNHYPFLMKTEWKQLLSWGKNQFHDSECSASSSFANFSSANIYALLWSRSGQFIFWPRFAQPWCVCAKNRNKGTTYSTISI